MFHLTIIDASIFVTNNNTVAIFFTYLLSCRVCKCDKIKKKCSERDTWWLVHVKRNAFSEQILIHYNGY